MMRAAVISAEARADGALIIDPSKPSRNMRTLQKSSAGKKLEEEQVDRKEDQIETGGIFAGGDMAEKAAIQVGAWDVRYFLKRLISSQWEAMTVLSWQRWSQADGWSEDLTFNKQARLRRGHEVVEWGFDLFAPQWEWSTAPPVNDADRVRAFFFFFFF